MTLRCFWFLFFSVIVHVLLFFFFLYCRIGRIRLFHRVYSVTFVCLTQQMYGNIPCSRSFSSNRVYDRRLLVVFHSQPFHEVPSSLRRCRMPHAVYTRDWAHPSTDLWRVWEYECRVVNTMFDCYKRWGWLIQSEEMQHVEINGSREWRGCRKTGGAMKLWGGKKGGSVNRVFNTVL